MRSKVITEYDEVLSRVKKIHFIGIGGSGMCPLVDILRGDGKEITGSDVDDNSDTVKRLRSFGIKVAIGQRAENIGDAELVVYSAAIAGDNPELVAAKESGVPTIERSVLLGAICRRYKNDIAISGTHGKTTTTSMVTTILMAGQLDPTVVIGGKLALIEGYGRAGQSENMVCEACEFVDTFLQITPEIAVILNIDADHLDYFGTLDNIIASFRQFANQTTGVVIANGDDANTMKALDTTKAKIITFGLQPSNDYYAENVGMAHGGFWKFDLMHKGEKLTDITLKVPGEHNVLNALAASAACLYVGATPDDVKKGLGMFSGASRRFEIHTVHNGITIADDYAHHPTEIEATLRACKEMDYKRVWAVFQPFTYTRTKTHMQEFADVLQIADKVVLTDIMGGREWDDLGIKSEDLQALIPGCHLEHTFEDVADYVLANAEDGDLVITMGCGDVYKCAKLMKAKLLAVSD